MIPSLVVFYVFLPRSIDRGLIEAIKAQKRRKRANKAFRDQLIAASLKLIVAFPSRSVVFSFRDQLIAASLKLTNQQAGADKDQPLPRSIDRGLIEAGPLGDRVSDRVSAFRDQLIAASLKLDVQAVQVGEAVTLPRSIDRGLIEAPMCAFRLWIRAAFRDQLIAASLKLCLERRVKQRSLSLPRSIDRGLIEAIPSRIGSIASYQPSAIN